MRIFVVIVSLLLSACASMPTPPSAEDVVRSYFEIYKERSDFDRFMDFYADGASLTDVVYGNELQGKDAIRSFFDWNRGDFKVATPGPILTVEQHIASGDVVITRGVFEPFEFGGQALGPWRFIIVQELNAEGKIIRQEDWINYTPKKILIGG
ncbi:MAG: nuclear transport factor 2 family protein [Acidobacteriota bacterium]